LGVIRTGPQRRDPDAGSDIHTYETNTTTLITLSELAFYRTALLSADHIPQPEFTQLLGHDHDFHHDESVPDRVGIMFSGTDLARPMIRLDDLDVADPEPKWSAFPETERVCRHVLDRYPETDMVMFISGYPALRDLKRFDGDEPDQDLEEIVRARCIVATCVSDELEGPDLRFLEVQLPLGQYLSGEHYELASRVVEQLGLEIPKPPWVVDTFDPVGRRLENLFVWESCCCWRPCDREPQRMERVPSDELARFVTREDSGA